MAHRYPIKVRFYELDPYNHLNHASYVQYFEVGRVELLESIGIGLAELQGLGRHIVVTEIHTRFLRSAGPHDTLVVETEVLEIRRATSRWRQRLMRGDEVIATQVVEAAMTDTTGKPVRFSSELAAALEPYRVEA
jgi:acyl-CoA thioester hydrolase